VNNEVNVLDADFAWATAPSTKKAYCVAPEALALNVNGWPARTVGKAGVNAKPVGNGSIVTTTSFVVDKQPDALLATALNIELLLKVEL